MVRKIVVALFVMAAASATAAPGGANVTRSPAFSAVGNVDTASAAFDPTPIDGQPIVSALILRPVHSGSRSAMEHVAEDGSLEIYTMATTFYYKKDENGQYVRSTREETVVEGQDVRVAGRRYANDQGVSRFVARAVWNPPNEPQPAAGGSLPSCGAESGLKNAAFNVKAVIVSKQVNYPCTGFGGYPGGFRVDYFGETPRADVARGIEAYGGRLQVYVTHLTRYFFGDTESTYSRVVRKGNEVRVLGRFQYVNGAWLFVANTVFTPAPDRPDTFNPRTDIDAFQDLTNPGHYAGNSYGPAFPPPGGRFQADVVWTPTGAGYEVAGTWALVNGRNVLRGTLDGTVEGHALNLSLEVTSGEGAWWGSVGNGDLEGEVAPYITGNPPDAFSGKIRLSVIRGSSGASADEGDPSTSDGGSTDPSTSDGGSSDPSTSDGGTGDPSTSGSSTALSPQVV